MAIKFGMKLPEIFAQLVRGYRKAIGRDPEGLDLIKIRQESMRRFEEMNKVVDMEGRTLDPDKVIMGGTQEGAALKSGIMKATNIKPRAVPESFQKQIEQKYGITLQGDETVDDIKKIIEDLPIDKKANGGRIGFGGGSDMGTVADSKGNVGVGKGGYQGQGDGKGGKAGGPGDGPDDRSTFEQTVNQLNPKTKGSKLRGLYNTTQDLNYLKNLMIGNFPGIGKQLLFDLGKRKFLDDRVKLDDQEEDNTMLADVSAKDLKQRGIFESTGFDYGDAKNMGMINPTMTREEFEGMMEGTITEPTGKFAAAEGGRIGFKKGMDRRTFMKIMGGLTTLPILGKFFKGAEVAAPVAKKAAEVASGAPTYFFDLVNKIKMFGKKSKVGPSERIDEYSYRGKNGDEYTLTEDITTGDAQITKDKMGIGTYGDKSFDTINDRSVMDYKAPKQDVDVETQRPINESAEYEEYRIEFDQDGTQAGADAIDELIQKEIMEEAAEEAPSIIKKASGGIARMLGE
jgi:hypothetical protein